MANQKGKVWRDHLGQDVPVTYLSKEVQGLERISAQMTLLAEELEAKVQLTKRVMAGLMLEAIELQNGTVQPVTTNVWSFYSFDRQYRFQIDQKNGYIRVFRAQKPGARVDQYDPVNMDFTYAKMLSEIDGAKLPPMLPTEDEMILMHRPEVNVKERHQQAISATVSMGGSIHTVPATVTLMSSTVESMERTPPLKPLSNDAPEDPPIPPMDRRVESAVDSEMDRINNSNAGGQLSLEDQP